MPGAISADNGETHFFISRAGADKAFAASVGRILDDAGYSVILQDWDFLDKNFMDRLKATATETD